jgi:hypothetical protein
MLEALIPIVVCTGMFAMIFGIVYIKSRENMALIEKGINPRQTKYRPRPFVNLKWGLLMLGCGIGLLVAFIIDSMLPDHHDKKTIEKKIVVNAPAKDSVKTMTDTAHNKPGKHIVIVKNGKTTRIDETPDGAIEKLEHLDDDTSGTANCNNISVNFGGHGKDDDNDTSPLYFALIAIGGGLGLFYSYRIEKREWLDKIDKMDKYQSEA